MSHAWSRDGALLHSGSLHKRQNSLPVKQAMVLGRKTENN